MTNLVTIKIFNNEAEANLARSILMKNGIKVVINKSNQSGISSFLMPLPAILGGNRNRYSLLVEVNNKKIALGLINY